MHTLGYYTGWAIAIVLLFVIPLMIVFISYLMTVNRQLEDIRDKLPPMPSGEGKKSVNKHGGDTYLKKLFPRRINRG